MKRGAILILERRVPEVQCYGNVGSFLHWGRAASVVVSVLCLAALPFLSAEAALSIPKASGAALGVTKGKSFNSGLVFVNGRYMPPPYVVERWGVGIRINGEPVVGQVISWKRILASQAAAEKSETLKNAPAVNNAAANEKLVKANASSAENKDDDAKLIDMMDSIFDDGDREGKSAPYELVEKPAGTTSKVATEGVATLKAEKDKASVGEVRQDIDFKHNEYSKAQVKKANAFRSEIDRKLREGGFYCFGDYPTVSGGSAMTDEILKTLPKLLQANDEKNAFVSALLRSDIGFLNDVIAEDMFRSRRQYIELKNRYKKLEKDRQWSKLLNQ